MLKRKILISIVLLAPNIFRYRFFLLKPVLFYGLDHKCTVICHPLCTLIKSAFNQVDM